MKIEFRTTDYTGTEKSIQLDVTALHTEEQKIAQDKIIELAENAVYNGDAAYSAVLLNDEIYCEYEM